MIKDIDFELNDLRYLLWAKQRRSSGTAGSFLKAYEESGKGKLYYKLSDYDVVKGIIGHECVNEIIVQRLLTIFGYEHLQYTLLRAVVSVNDKEYETWLCRSYDYKRPGDKKMALEDYYDLEKKDGEKPYEFCKRMGWNDYVNRMLIADFIILNRDRHGANMEVLRSVGNGSVRLAPLFDHGLSLCCRCHDKKDWECFDVMEDRKIQSFIGGNSLYDNLRMVQKTYLRQIPAFDDCYKEDIFAGIDSILPKEWIDKLWELIRRRWKFVETFRNQG